MQKGNVVSFSQEPNQLDIPLVCDPRRSVVVSACAGSGKTWLLVARLVRILLAGESPRSILALTFTRKAAQEMRDRLYSLLHSWTHLSDTELVKELQERGIAQNEAMQSLHQARSLYNTLLANPHPIVIDTYHGWFGSLLSGAPVSMGVQQGFSLREDAKRLQSECLEDWWSSLSKELEAKYEILLDHLGSNQTNQFLQGANSILRQRGAWVFFEKACRSLGKSPIDVLKDQLAYVARPNPLFEELNKKSALHELKQLLDGLQHGGKNDQKLSLDLALAIECLEQRNIQGAAEALLPVLMTRDDLPTYRKDNDKVTNDTAAYLKVMNINPEQFVEIRQSWGRVCEDFIAWRTEHDAIVLNEAWFTISAAIIQHTQRTKERLRVRDFDDLELGVAEMIADSRIAAYLQARLDARYNHILIDEFQDTNPLQWQILKSWLEAYGDDVNRPNVFIVGDPKQSIYRFRRADPRLFIAAKHFLHRHYGAALQEQNTTRRNAPEIVKAVNAIFAQAHIPESYPFHPQTTTWTAPPLQKTTVYQTGEAYRLKLIPVEEVQKSERSGNALETPLLDIHQTPAARQRLQEGQVVAALIRHVLHTRQVLDEEIDASNIKVKRQIWRQAQPGDFLLLVKRRAYLSEYERALKDAGLLYETPRLGGLLETLEVEDLIALLTILVTPANNLALAQVLRSPLFALNEAQMQTLAELVQSNQGYRHWWEALTQGQNHPHQSQFEAVTQQLKEWIDLAKHLPVHDLLDHIYFSGDVRMKYAMYCQESDREQVLANLDAFLELALHLDGGRYPSLGRFITQLNRMRRGDEDETPDEGEMSGDYHVEDFDPLVDVDDEGEDSLDLIERRSQRVRLMTIHGAKGLEAPFVILLDANNTASPHFSHGVLLDWNPEQTAPSHLSMFTKLTLGRGREELREQEKDIALKENWNLLYVAITRAKQGFWMSGVESSKNQNDEGVIKDSWYARARNAELQLFTELDEIDLASTSALESVKVRKLNLPHQFECKDLILSWQGEKPSEEAIAPSDSEQQKILSEGVWFHGVLQRITPQQYRPSPSLPTAEAIASALMISLTDAQLALQRALMVYQSPQLQTYFDPKQYEQAWNELDLVTVDGKSMRVDRLVEFSDSLVILDYKLTIPAFGELLYEKYTAQLANYRRELQRIYPHKPIKAMLIDAQGQGLPLSD